VLHPGLKLEYFQQKEWEAEWIDNAEELTYKVYVTRYEGKGDPVVPMPSMTTELVCLLQIIFIDSNTNQTTV
jgi:hypothetical protein